jgi:hypothetical protein
MNKRDKKVEEVFQRCYEEWQGHVRRPEVRISSRTEDYLRCPAFEKIVELGEPALPFIMEKLRQGDFFLHHAAGRITGLDIVRERAGQEGSLVGEQGLAELWLRWWQEQQQALRRSLGRR